LKENNLKKLLFLVPARGGSKGIVKKNIIPLNGIPLIAYVLKTIQRSIKQIKNFQCRLIVTSDNNQIKKISKSYMAEAPFTRPEKLSDDNSKSIDVVFHALGWLAKNESYKPNSIALIQPTSPFIITQDILNVLSMHQKENRPTVSVVKNSHPIEWSFRVNNQKIEPIFENNINRRQDSSDSYHLNGAIYISQTKDLLKYQSFINSQTYAYVMPFERSIDIDTPFDLEQAEFMIKKRNRFDG
jgi:CMP-N,N'-diacetyllegionaminic acid synthase